MLLRVFSSVRRFYSVQTVLAKNKVMESQKCYFRYIQDDDRIDVTFLLKIKDTLRQFNFSRSPTEPLETLFSRIGTNIQKALKKAYKKNKSENKDVDVMLNNSRKCLLNSQSTCNDLLSSKEIVELQINGSIYEVVINSPWVVSINLPQCILAGFPVYPENFTIHYANKSLCKFNWYIGTVINEKGSSISENHVKWVLVSRKHIYHPKSQDIGKKLKLECIPADSDRCGPAVEVISKNVIEAGPGKCPFESRHMFTRKKLKDKRFRCVTYNILADLYCDSDFTRTSLHPYCPPYALNIDYRKLLILKELLGYNADLICLQEVDTKVFNNYLYPLLQDEMLKGLFYKKGKKVAEGLALFYREDRFRVLGEERIILSEVLTTKTCLQEIWNTIKDNEPLTKRLLDRSTAASATYLQSLENENEILLVGNTHLYFHPDADHIRLIQGGIFIYWLNDTRKKLIEEFPDKRISLILCGDFNSVPSCGIYQLYTTGHSPSSLPDWTSNSEEAVYNLNLHQDRLLKSACGTPPFTNYTALFADCLDYIFYDKSSIQVKQVVPLPSLEELQANTALPSIVFPSDHIALIADLEFV